MPNVLMIVADTVRNDYLGVHGGSVHTPNLDRLARESVDFSRMRSASFPTVPTRADYAAGVYSLTGSGWGPLPRHFTTVAEIASRAGVNTAGVADTPFYRINGYNLERGFDCFYDLPTQGIASMKSDAGRTRARGNLIPQPRRSEYDYCAPRTVTTAEQCLEQLVDAEPFLLLVDTWDPHEPWDPPAWYVKRYKPDYDGRVVQPPYGRYSEHGLSDEDLETARACYKGELEMVDRWIGRLLERLESLGIAQDTAVIFTSDHGFYFGEHDGLLGKMIGSKQEQEGRLRWLRSPLYNELVNVPLFVRVPGVEPRVEPGLVSAIDTAPTVLELLGLEPDAQMIGHSLVPVVRSGEPVKRKVALSAAPLAAPGDQVSVVDDVMRRIYEWQPITVTTQDWTLLFSRWEDPIELYAASDQAQQHNLAAEHPDVVEELHGLMVQELRLGGVSETDLEPRYARGAAELAV